ncbi:MAG: TetR/AcrR family transcriptional regulator [candidate division Zixibacteria bacterium]|nr:TetR/AcrR family transcriptional regulator [candidate division Zixibacteria bacterium]
MGTLDRKEREKEQRLNEILDAAERVFIANGYHNCTMDQIAEEAELSKGTLYLYFKSKEAIFVGLDWRGTKILRKRFQEAYDTVEIGRQKVIEIGRSYFQFVADYPLYFQMMNHAVGRPSDITQSLEEEAVYQKCQEEEGATLAVLADAISCGIEDGSVADDVEPLQTAILLWAMSNGVIQLHHNHGEDIKNWFEIDPSFLFDKFFAFIDGAIAPKP